MTNTRQIPDKNETNQRHHPTEIEYVCKCGSGADVWDSWDMYCAKCYLQKQKDSVQK